MEDQLLKRILRKFRMERAFSVMSEQMKRHQLITFLMGLAARRSRSVSPADVLLQMDDDRFLGASIVSQRDFHAVDAVAFRLARAFEAVELSPLAPLGVCSAVAPVDSRWMVHSTRFQELTSDSTNVLAAVAAKRRRTELGSGANRVVRLCSSHRHTRAQAFENPMFSAHFRVFALISAGRDTGNFSFELAELEEHLSFYTRFFRAFKQTESKGLHVTFSSSGGQAERKCMEFADRYLDAEDGITWSVSPDNLQEGGYYWPVRVQLRAVENNTIDIVDGGLVDWTQQFLSDRKERLLISGIGTEVFVKKFLL